MHFKTTVWVDKATGLYYACHTHNPSIPPTHTLPPRVQVTLSMLEIESQIYENEWEAESHCCVFKASLVIFSRSRRWVSSSVVLCSPHGRRLVVSDGWKTDPPVWPVAGRKLCHPCLKSFPSHSSALHRSSMRSLLRARDEKDFLWSNGTSLIWASSPATSPTKKTPSKSRGRAGIPLSRPLFLYSFTTVPWSALSSRSLMVMNGDRLSAPHFTLHTEEKKNTQCKW